MTVTRQVVITYDAPDEAAAEEFENDFRETVINAWHWQVHEDHHYDISGQSFMAGPVAPSPEPLVEPEPRSREPGWGEPDIP